MEVPKPDFDVEVESLEEEPDNTMPKIIPMNVPLVEKPVETSTIMPMLKPVEKLAVKPVLEPVLEPVEVQDTLEQPSTQLAETIEIENPQTIFPHIEPYPETSPKQHHFLLKHKTDRTQLINIGNQNNITVELNESGKNNVDVTLTRQDQLIGKIQFLHFDRRDRSIRTKHYVKLYLYQFDDSAIFEKTKQIMRDFFHQIGSRPRHRSIHRISRTRRSYRKKSRSTRKHKKTVRK